MEPAMYGRSTPQQYWLRNYGTETFSVGIHPVKDIKGALKKSGAVKIRVKGRPDDSEAVLALADRIVTALNDGSKTLADYPRNIDHRSPAWENHLMAQKGEKV